MIIASPGARASKNAALPVMAATLLAPAATPKDIVVRLNAEMVRIIQSPEFRKRMDEIGRVMAAVGTDKPQYAEELVNLQPAPSGDAPKGGPSPKDKDELYEAAVEVVIREGRGSVSLLFSVGLVFVVGTLGQGMLIRCR